MDRKEWGFAVMARKNTPLQDKLCRALSFLDVAVRSPGDYDRRVHGAYILVGDILLDELHPEDRDELRKVREWLLYARFPEVCSSRDALKGVYDAIEGRRANADGWRDTLPPAEL